MLDGSVKGCAGCDEAGELVCAVCWMIFSSGKYNKLDPALVSINTLVVLLYICCMVSIYMRSRITCGAFWYSATNDLKRWASPWACDTMRDL